MQIHRLHVDSIPHSLSIPNVDNNAHADIYDDLQLSYDLDEYAERYISDMCDWHSILSDEQLAGKRPL